MKVDPEGRKVEPGNSTDGFPKELPSQKEEEKLDEYPMQD